MGPGGRRGRWAPISGKSIHGRKGGREGGRKEGRKGRKEKKEKEKKREKNSIFFEDQDPTKTLVSYSGLFSFPIPSEKGEPEDRISWPQALRTQSETWAWAKCNVVFIDGCKNIHFLESPPDDDWVTPTSEFQPTYYKAAVNSIPYDTREGGGQGLGSWRTQISHVITRS